LAQLHAEGITAFLREFDKAKVVQEAQIRESRKELGSTVRPRLLAAKKMNKFEIIRKMGKSRILFGHHW
jgi:hypothetical protein